MQATTEKKRPCVYRVGFEPIDRAHTMREALSLAEVDFDTHVVGLRAERGAEFEVPDGVVLHPLGITWVTDSAWRSTLNKILFTFLAKTILLRLLLRRSRTIVQIDFTPNVLVWIAVLARIFGARVVLRMPQPVPERLALSKSAVRRLLRPIARVAERVSVTLAHRTIVPTREMRDDLGMKGCDIHRIAVVVDIPEEAVQLSTYRYRLAEIAELRKQERRSGVFRIATVAGEGIDDGLEDVIRALSSVAERIPGAELVIVGSAEQLSAALSLASRLKIGERVHSASPGDVDDAVQRVLPADVGVVATRLNPYSRLVLASALFQFAALEKPLVASRLPTTESYFPDNSVVYFEPGNTTDLADKLYYIFAHPEEMAGRTAKAFDLYEAHSWERESKKYRSVFKGIVEST